MAPIRPGPDRPRRRPLADNLAGPSRCFPFWQELLACYVVNTNSEDDSGKKKCAPVLEDYYECLHHKKEVGIPMPEHSGPSDSMANLLPHTGCESPESAGGIPEGRGAWNQSGLPDGWPNTGPRLTGEPRGEIGRRPGRGRANTPLALHVYLLHPEHHHGSEIQGAVLNGTVGLQCARMCLLADVTVTDVVQPSPSLEATASHVLKLLCRKRSCEPNLSGLPDLLGVPWGDSSLVWTVPGRQRQNRMARASSDNVLGARCVLVNTWAWHWIKMAFRHQQQGESTARAVPQ